MVSELKKFIACLLALVFMCSFSSCRGIELENKTEEIEEYTKSQVMIFIANERNHYQNAYTSSIWEVKTDDGQNFDELIIENVRKFLQEIKLLNMLAAEKGVSLTSLERDYVRQMTDEYMEGLTVYDEEYIGCTRDDVQKMYQEYYIACKVTELITGTTGTDISDSEVKVIKVMQIGTEDLKKAKAILKKIKIDGSDFNSMASRYSELDQIEITLSRGTSGDLIERTAFSLDEGMVSNILCLNDMYYIIKVTDGYDEEATVSRKTRIVDAIKSGEYQEIMESYKSKHRIAFREKFWDDLSFSADYGSSVCNFFTIFDKYSGV